MTITMIWILENTFIQVYTYTFKVGSNEYCNNLTGIGFRMHCGVFVCVFVSLCVCLSGCNLFKGLMA